MRRQKDPVWHVPVSVIKEHKENGEDLDAVIGPGPDNPLGRYAFYLGWSSYLIHGTNKPAGVGLRSSHGCIRLYPEDIESFYDMIPVGTQVRVVNQPFLFGWQDGELYMQASGPLEDDSHDGKKAQADGLPKAQQARIEKQLKHRDATLNTELVAALAREPRGIPVAVSRADASLEEVLASAPKCRTACPKGPPGTASPICRPMRRVFVKCSPIAIRRRRRCARRSAARACEDRHLETENYKVADLSEWLQLMLAEIARKQEELDARAPKRSCARAKMQPMPDSARNVSGVAARCASFGAVARRHRRGDRARADRRHRIRRPHAEGAGQSCGRDRKLRRLPAASSAACGSPRPLAYAVEQFFENGGRDARIVRVVNGARPPTLTLRAGARELQARSGSIPVRASTCAPRSTTTASARTKPDRFNLVVQRLRADALRAHRGSGDLPAPVDRSACRALRDEVLLRVASGAGAGLAAERASGPFGALAAGAGRRLRALQSGRR